MCFLSKYSTLLGEPGKGIHTHVFGVAMADVGMTVLAAWFLHRVWSRVSFWRWLLGLFLLGILLHRLFGVRTVVDRWVFGKKNLKNC